MKKNKRKALVMIIFIVVNAGVLKSQSNEKIEAFTFQTYNTLLLDGAIQDVKGSGIDQSSTGQIGFRHSGFFGKFEIKFTAGSGTTQQTKSSNVSDYSVFVLNPFQTRSGFDAIHASFFRRNFTRNGTIVNYSRFLYKTNEIKSSQFDQIIEDFELEKNKGLLSRLGYLVDLNVSNFAWTNQTDVTLNGNIIAINPFLIVNQRTKFLDNQVDIVAGVGPSYRIIAGDITNQSDFLMEILGSKEKKFFGTQFTVQAFINNFYAKANYAVYNKETSIEGFTGGQFYVSIGIQANIGQITNTGKEIKDLKRKDLFHFAK